MMPSWFIILCACFIACAFSALVFFFVVALPLIIEDRRDRRRYREELEAQAYIDHLRFLSAHPEYKLLNHLFKNGGKRK